MLIIIMDFIGRLHPVLVHLPIGILIIACILQWFSAMPRFKELQQSMSFVLFCGTLAAIASCISGYILSLSDDYEMQLVNTHLWFGISTAILSIALYFSHRHGAASKIRQWIAVILFLVIILTGHFGGSLTHGSDYLSFSASAQTGELKQKPIADIQEAVAYTDVIQPILQSKCYSCHGKSKQKGGLRVDDSIHLWKGGKDGIVLIDGKPDESEMIKRLLLPRNHEDHMPPKEKPQLNEQEIALLHWWIASGVPFHKKVKELQQSEKIKPMLFSLQNISIEKPVIQDIPPNAVTTADERSINKIRDRGVVILPVAQNSNYLMASFVSTDSVRDSDMELLLPIRQQLIWLKLGHSLIGDSSLTIISKLNNITRLQLNHTHITDRGLVSLQSMNNLQYLNLVGTKVTAQGISTLKELKNLQSLYLYQTLIKSSEWQALKNNFPNTIIDSGGYAVPLFESDTQIVKPRVRN